MTFVFALTLLVAAPSLSFAERVEGTRASPGSLARVAAPSVTVPGSHTPDPG
jgi:hypothetical protein